MEDREGVSGGAHTERGELNPAYCELSICIPFFCGTTTSSSGGSGDLRRRRQSGFALSGLPNQLRTIDDDHDDDDTVCVRRNTASIYVFVFKCVRLCNVRPSQCRVSQIGACHKSVYVTIRMNHNSCESQTTCSV